MEKVIYLNNINWGKITLDSQHGFKFVNFLPVHAVNITFTANGSIPYITRTSLNNGISGFINEINVDKKYINSGNCISFGGETGCFFYQSIDFVAGNNMHGIYHPDMSKKSALILVTILTKAFSAMYSYGYAMIPSRIKEKEINVPITKNKEIDFKMMEKIYDENVQKIINIPETKNKILNNTISLNDRKWKLFIIDKLFNVYAGADLPKYNRNKGNIPFIGSSSRNNGVTDWIDNNADKTKYSKNSLGVNRNGSVGYTFYHPYKAYFSGDTRFLKAKEFKLTPEIGLFLSTAISQQKKQFGYGFKLGSKRLKKIKINLPVDANGDPDWQFMEDYIKSLPNGDLI